jgi:hypothetical protein
MVGGKIIEVRDDRRAGTTRLWVMDNRPPHDEAAIYVETQAEMPVAGDAVWWQGRSAMWTPADRRFVDRVLPRIGYSFTPRP